MMVGTAVAYVFLYREEEEEVEDEKYEIMIFM